MPDGRIGLYTVDFFPPVVDDLEAYGAIAAANSLSDIYASGGEARVVLNLAGFPEEWDEDVLAPIFRGAVAKVMEAGALWVGGHSVRSAEPLYGFAVFGDVSEQDLVTNSGARAGDRLLLTKPLGAGSLTTGLKRGVTRAEDLSAAIAGMAHLNRGAAVAMRAAGVRAATDITGFGLLGHAANVARASGQRLVLDAAALPLYAGAAELAQQGVYSGGSARGRAGLGELVRIGPGVADWLATLCFDAETSGGMLIAVAPDALGAFHAALPAGDVAVEVGEVQAGAPEVLLG